MKSYVDNVDKMQLIQATEKYSLYYNQEKDDLVIYNGFSTCAFDLNSLGASVFKGAYQPYEKDNKVFQVLDMVDGILKEAIESLDKNEPVNGLGYARELLVSVKEPVTYKPL